MKRVHVLISGLVQGVFFRYHIYNLCQKLGINGWVKNTVDGKVEAVFEGKEDSIDKILRFCRRGPELARVDKVEVWEEKFEDKFKTFEIRY
jgi:acylphosphatase